MLKIFKKMLFKSIIIIIIVVFLNIISINAFTVNDKYLLPRIIQQPQSQIAQTGSKVTFKCDYDTIDTLTLTSTLAISTYIQIKWLFNLQQIQQQTQNDYIIDKNRLIINKFNELKHSGEYRCLINNTYISWSILSEPANLTVAYIDTLITDSTNDDNNNNNKDIQMSISEGNVAIISCKLPSSNPPAIPLFVLNNSILIDNEIPRYKIFPSGNLQISNVKSTDSGVYTCSARNPVTNEIRNNTKRTILKVYEPSSSQAPNIIYSPNNANRVAIGSNITLECVANGAPVPLITWEKFGGTLPDKRSTQLFGNLILTNIQQEDRGTYVCKADNGPGQTKFKTAMIDVFESPTLLNLNDGTINSLSSQIVKYYANRNDNIELKCPIRSRPKSDIQWFFNGRLLISNQFNYYLITERSLLIKNVNQQLIGAYQCFARNEFGYKQAQIILYLKEDLQEINQDLTQQQQQSVQSIQSTNIPVVTTYGSKPTILIGPQNVTIFEGQTIVLLCVTEANAQINWLQNDLIIEPSVMRRFEVNQVGNLRIVSAQKSDSGVYKCIASNEFGMTTAEGYVSVKDDESLNQRKSQTFDVDQAINKKSNKLYPIPSRPTHEQIDVDKILLKWDLIKSDNNQNNDDGTVNSNVLLSVIDYFKIEYKIIPIKQQQQPSMTSSNWITIDEKIDSTKREYILTDLSLNEYYRFRLNCVYKNGYQMHSMQSNRIKLLDKSKFIDLINNNNQQQQSNNNNNNNNNSNNLVDLIEIQIQQVWALSDNSLAIKWQLFNDYDQQPQQAQQTNVNQNGMNKQATTTTSTQSTTTIIDGFYIYYRKLSTQELLLNVNNKTQNEIINSNENYQLIKIPNSQFHLVDTYIITNLDAYTTYEIKITCFNQYLKQICEQSNVVYGVTLNKTSQIDLKQAQLAKFLTKSPILNSQSEAVVTAVNQNIKQNEILFMVLGIILGVLTLLLIIFVIMCVVRHRQHKKLLVKLNTSQKLNSGSSCPTLIYDDCMRNMNNNQHSKLINTLNGTSNTNTNNNINNSTTTTTAVLLNDALNNNQILTLLHNPTSTFNNNNNNSSNNTQTTLLSNSSQPPPIPSVPPPQITSTLNRNINLNVNPIGYLDANTFALNFIKQQQQQQQQQHQQQQQENFYHTLNMNQLIQHNQNSTSNSDYTNATLNLRTHLLFKQQQQQQQQQPQAIIIEALNPINTATLQRTSCLASPALSFANDQAHHIHSNTATPKKRNRRSSTGSHKNKKYEKIYQIHNPENNQNHYHQHQQQQQQEFDQQQQQQQQNLFIFSSILNNNEAQQQQTQLLLNHQHHLNDNTNIIDTPSKIYKSNKYLQLTINNNSNNHHNQMNNMMIDDNCNIKTNIQNNQNSCSSNSSGIGSTATTNSGDSLNEELVPFIFSSSQQTQQLNNDQYNSDYEYNKRLRVS